LYPEGRIQKEDFRRQALIYLDTAEVKCRFQKFTKVAFKYFYLQVICSENPPLAFYNFQIV